MLILLAAASGKSLCKSVTLIPAFSTTELSSDCLSTKLVCALANVSMIVLTSSSATAVERAP